MRYVEPHPKSGVYRVRVPVAPHLRAVLGQTAYTKTLGTKDRAKAEKQAYGVIAEFQRRIESAEGTLRTTVIEGAASPALAPREAVAGAIHSWVADTQARVTDAIWRGGRDAPLRQITPEFGSEGAAGFRRAYRHALLGFVADPAARAVAGDHEARLRSLLRRVLSEAGVTIPPDGAPLTEAALHLLTDAMNVLAAEHEKLRHDEWTLAATGPSGNYGHRPAAVSDAPAAARGGLGAELVPITINSFLDDFLAEGRCEAASSASELRLAVRRLLSFLGREDVQLHEISYEQAREFRDALLRLPKHMTAADWKRGVRQLALDHKEGRDTRPRLLAGTVGKGVRLLRSMMRLAVQRGRIERHVFDGLTMKGALKSKGSRKPFSPSEVETIFSAPLFTGCQSAKEWWLPGTFAVRDHRYWIPLIAQTMGLRLEEAGQLCVSDVPTRHGVACLAIAVREDDDEDDDGDNTEDTAARLKTESSERFVPVHPLLVELGFLRMVEERRRNGQERLFPELTRSKAGKLTASVSKWFCSRFLPRVGIVHRAKKFHSFRHAYCDNARNSDGIEPEVRKALMGHASAAAHDAYGDGHSMTKLRAAVERLVLPGMPTAKLLAASVR